MRYYGRWLKTAFVHNLFGRAEKVVAFIAVWIAPCVKLATGKDVVMSGELALQVLFYVLVALVGWRLLLAPYWMHQEDQKTATNVSNQRDSLVAIITDRKADDARTRLGHIRDTLLRHADSVQQINGMIYRPADDDRWVRVAQQMIQDSLSPHACQKFRASFGDRNLFELSVASLRTLASDLTLEDLKRQ